MHGVTVRETVLFKEVINVFSLMNPQLLRLPVPLELDAQKLSNRPHIRYAKLHVQLVLYLLQERFIITPPHHIVNMPSCQALHAPLVVSEDGMVSSATNETQTLQFLSQCFIEHVCGLFDTVERGVEPSN